MTMHNWIVDQAIAWLQSQGKLPFDPDRRDENGFGLSAREYIAYGLWFADSPWGGPPEDEDALVEGILDQLGKDDVYYKQVTDDDGDDYFRIQTVWKDNHDKEATNTYMEARYHVKCPELGIKLDKRYAGDNMYHYANDQRVRFDLTDKNWVDGHTAFDSCQVHAYSYGAQLYKLAREFLPQNIYGHGPDINSLQHVFAGNGKSGRIVMKYYDAAGWPTIEADLPSTYLGANPFTCINGESGPKGDPCNNGDPTWPIWVPSAKTIAYRGQTSKIDAFHAALTEENPAKSYRASLIYLGWALHLLGDLSVPDHAADIVGIGHEDLENRANDLISKGVFSSQNYPHFNDADSEFKNLANKTQKSMCYGFFKNKPYSAEGVQAIFEEMADLAKINYSGIHSERYELSSFDSVVNEAIKNSIKLIACLNVDPDNYNFYNHTRSFVFRSPLGLGNMCLDLPNGNTTNGTNVQLHYCNGATAQKWILSDDGYIHYGGDYSKCLDAEGPSSANGTAIQLWDCKPQLANQQWTVDWAFGAIHTNQDPSKCIDVKAANPAPGTKIQLWGCNGTNAQRWDNEFKKSTVKIRSSLGEQNKCLDLPNGNTANGTALQLYSCDDVKAQRWILEDDGHIHYAGDPQKCLDARGPSSANGTIIQLWDCRPGYANQVWIVNQAKGTIQTSQSLGQCVDVKDGATANHTPIQLWGCNGTAAQYWFIRPADPPVV
jgi:hypothetical protein